jgi:hypothetical protein
VQPPGVPLDPPLLVVPLLLPLLPPLLLAVPLELAPPSPLDPSPVAGSLPTHAPRTASMIDPILSPALRILIFYHSVRGYLAPR